MIRLPKKFITITLIIILSFILMLFVVSTVSCKRQVNIDGVDYAIERTYIMEYRDGEIEMYHTDDTLQNIMYGSLFCNIHLKDGTKINIPYTSIKKITIKKLRTRL